MITTPDIVKCRGGPGNTCWELMCGPCSEEVSRLRSDCAALAVVIQHVQSRLPEIVQHVETIKGAVDGLDGEILSRGLAVFRAERDAAPAGGGE